MSRGYRGGAGPRFSVRGNWVPRALKQLSPGKAVQPMKVSDLLLAVLAVITGAVVLMSLSHREFVSTKAFFGILLIAGGLTYLWKHRAKYNSLR